MKHLKGLDPTLPLVTREQLAAISQRIIGRFGSEHLGSDDIAEVNRIVNEAHDVDCQRMTHVEAQDIEDPTPKCRHPSCASYCDCSCHADCCQCD